MAKRDYYEVLGKTALQIIDLVRQNSSNHEKPDNIYGYGVPNFWRAYMVGRASQP